MNSPMLPNFPKISDLYRVGFMDMPLMHSGA